MTQLIPGGLGRKLKPEDVAEDTRYYTELKRMEAKKAVMALGIAMLEKAQQLGLFSGPAGSGGSGGGGKPSPKGGPYIGPRGGKWADAQHTIPWKEHVSVARASAPDVLDDGVKFGAKLSEGVDVRASDRNLYITADKGKRDNILNVRKQVLEYLRKKYPGRSFAAAKSGGYQLWWTRVGGNADRLRAGIRISVTPEEQHALVMGGWRGLSGKPVAEQQADVVAGQSVKLEHIEHKPEKPGRGVKAARGQVFSSLETHPSDWAALEPSGFSEEEKTKKVMPTYHFPEGYKQPDTEMSAQGGEACQICGTNIKNVFWIAHHQKKLMLAVGSECVNKYAEAHMPHAAEALKRITSIKVKPEEVDHVNRLMTAGKPMDVAVARARARSAALKKYDKDNPSGNPDERERAVIKKEIAAAVKTDPEVVQWTKILAQHTAAKKTFFETDPAKKNPPVSGDQWEQVRRSAADLHIREKSDVKALQQLILSAEGNAKGRAEDEMGLKRTGWKAQNARVDLAGIEANAANMKYVSEHVREKAQADLESRIRGAVRYSLPHLGQQEQRDWIAKIPALVQHVSGKSQQSAMVGTRESIMKKSMTTESGKKITFKQLEAKIRASGGAGNPAAVAAKVYRESGADPAEEKKKKHRKEAAKSALVERGMALMKGGAGEGSRGGKVVGHTAGGKKSVPDPTLTKGYYPGPRSNITEWSNQFYDSPYGVDALKLLKEQASLKREEEEMEKRRKDYSELDAMPKGERDATRKRQRADEESLSEKRRTIAAKMATLEEKLLDHRIQQEEIKAKMGKSRRPTWPDGRYLTKNKLHEPLPHLLKGEAGMEVPEDVFARTSIEMTPNIVDGYALLNYPGSTPETQREKVSALFGEETPVEVDEHGNIPDVKGPFGSSY